MRDYRLTAAEREFVLDEILTALWKGQLTREAAVGRLKKRPFLKHVLGLRKNADFPVESCLKTRLTITVS